MSGISIKATRMDDAHVSYISLVERGANRIPFKIVKQEKPMSNIFKGLDLGTVGSIFARKAEKEVPAVVGVVAMKGESFESLKTQVASAGFSVDKFEEQGDGSVIFKQEDMVAGTAVTVVKLSDHLAIVMKGFSPYGMDMSSGDVSFADACSAQGFYPGIQTIMSVMAGSVSDAVYGAASPNDAKSSVSKMFDEAKAYTLSFLGALPVAAFKLETIVPEVVVSSKADPDEEVVKDSMTDAEKTYFATLTGDAKMAFMKGTTAERAALMKATEDAADGGKDNAAEGADGTKTTAKKDETGAGAAPVIVAKAEEVVAVALTEEEISSIVSTQVGKATQELSESIKSIAASIAKSTETVSATVKALADRVGKAEGVAEKAATAVTGKVVSGSEGADLVPAAKAEPKFYGEIDTGFMPRQKKDRK